MADRATRIFLRLEPRLRTIARLYSRRREDAEDLTQTAALEIVRQISIDPGHTDSYLLERGARTIANAARAERSRAGSLDPLDDLLAPLAAPAALPVEDLTPYPVHLSAEERSVYRARYVAGLSIEETATRSRRSKDAVYRLQRAVVDKFRETLRRAGISKRADL